MKLTDEEREELKELYESYKNVTDNESLKLLGGLIRTSKWYKNHKITYECTFNRLWENITLRYILSTCPTYKVNGLRKKSYVILYFLQYLIKTKNPIIYKPI